MYCIYYQAHVRKADCWFVVAILRSFEHLAFDRTHIKANSVFEFFVPEQNEKHFLQLMDYFIGQDIISSLIKLPNRLLDPQEIV